VRILDNKSKLPSGHAAIRIHPIGYHHRRFFQVDPHGTNLTSER
jgi:hypothetical protein